jgi:hypothetical protein
VKQKVMVLLVVGKRTFLARNPRFRKVGKHAEAIRIREDTRKGHQLAISRIVGGCAGTNQLPTRCVSGVI